ncbi:unnamed protein product [Miscanthus lutarioriparius]|uniref:Uncharacterized protein n=1 Tax=Miscanthus lutarioriparius TaxID=422564 RepID=A0A811PI78_9POAL|nr:unnamed protein product [Miscanthus lutarioriparius]
MDIFVVVDDNVKRLKIAKGKGNARKPFERQGYKLFKRCIIYRYPSLASCEYADSVQADTLLTSSHSCGRRVVVQIRGGGNRAVPTGGRLQRPVRLLLRAGGSGTGPGGNGIRGASPHVVGHLVVRLGAGSRPVRGVAVAVIIVAAVAVVVVAAVAVVVVAAVALRGRRRAVLRRRGVIVVVVGAGRAEPAVDREAHSWMRRRPVLALDLSTRLPCSLLLACL